MSDENKESDVGLFLERNMDGTGGAGVCTALRAQVVELDAGVAARALSFLDCITHFPDEIVIEKEVAMVLTSRAAGFRRRIHAIHKVPVDLVY